MRKLRCFYHAFRYGLAVLLHIRRERIRSLTPCKADCCGHGHIYCMVPRYEMHPAVDYLVKGN